MQGKREWKDGNSTLNESCNKKTCFFRMQRTKKQIGLHSHASLLFANYTLFIIFNAPACAAVLKTRPGPEVIKLFNAPAEHET